MNEKLAKIIISTAYNLDAQIDGPDVEALAKAIESAFVLTERKPREFWIIKYEDSMSVELNKVISVKDSLGEEAEIIHVREVEE